MAITTQARSGFALVIALSLMAFVLLLILSITSFVVVEQQSANIAKQQLVAKQNALLGLQVAIGELQRRLGPDQRATASADILDGSNNPYTLVWHSDSTKGWNSATNDWSDSGATADFSLPLLSVDPAKLISLTDNGKFNESLLDNPVELMAITKPSDGTLTSLKAERRPLVDAQGATTGNYAWVAQDESLKANLKTEHGGTMTKDAGGAVVDSGHKLALVETSRRLSVFPYANAAGIEIEGELPFRAVDPVVNGELNDEYFEKIQKAEDLSDLITGGLLDPADGSGSKAKQLAPYRNHFTLNSKGVLADAKNGGLRRDLSRGLDDQYFKKLHGLPVFGVDRDGKVVADGVNEPVGDQWNFFRDYYNFYRPVDDGLADAISPENQLFGLDDATSYEPVTRMRFTNQVVGRDVVHNFPRVGTNPSSDTGFARAQVRPYEGEVTPEILSNLGYRTHSNNLNFNLSQTNWNLFTPQLRPVVIRNSLKISLKPILYTDPAGGVNNGKYYLEFKVYPTFTIWNPFNVAIEFDHTLLSNNPFANGYEMYLHQQGTMKIKVGVIRENGTTGPTGEYQLTSFSPNVALINKDSLLAELGGTIMPPGKVMICGLTQNYYADRNTWNPQYFTDAKKTGSKSGYIKLGLGTGILEANHITYSDALQGDWDKKRIYYNATDILALEPLNTGTGDDTYSWLGQIKSKKKSGGDTRCDSFYQGENANVYGFNSAITPLQTVKRLADENILMPLDAIDIRARTIASDTADNPAFPVFAQMNLMGTHPQVVNGHDSGNVDGDVRMLYISKLMESALSEPINGRGSDGFGSYGPSFISSVGKSTILLYDLPRHPIVSMGDFKNLVFSWNEDTSPRPIGASWPIGTIKDLDKTFIPVGSSDSAFNIGAGCDASYHYNDTLFDSYFLSGIPSKDRDKNVTFPYQQSLTNAYVAEGSPLANTQLVYYGKPTATELLEQTVSESGKVADAFEAAASHLLIDTPFNVNSTSSIAWQAVLSGFRNQVVQGVDSGKSKSYTDDGTPYIDHFVPSGKKDDLYAGHRRLSDEQLNNFSENLVEEIRDRGVAKSLGSFINRDLAGAGNNLKMSRIDEAIVNAEINSSSETVATTIWQSDIYPLDAPGYKPAAHAFGNSIVKEAGAGLPGYFKQQDILRPLAPVMTTRGDTFIIRAYGESIDPITKSVTGRAWCEVTLQRNPDYLNEETPAWTFPPTDAISSKFGRSFSIIDFRWLNSEDTNS
jgi:hypothetical protein